MKTSMLFPFLALAALLIGGCARAPFPLMGLIYTDGKAPYHAVENASAGKTGKACATSILGLIATGDASIDAAMRDGGVTQVAAVDYSTKSFMGIWAEFCTIATGK